MEFNLAIESLKGKLSSDIWHFKVSNKLPGDLSKRARFLMEIMNASDHLENLKICGSPPDIRLHKLTGNYKGMWSITIHKLSGWRIIFKFKEGNFIDVEIIDYH